MAITIAPPPDLTEAPFVALVLPFGEKVSPFHDHAGRVYRWGDVRLPRQPVSLREEHDGKEIGLLSDFVLDEAGIWAKVKPGRTATTLIAKGATGISAEIDDGKLTGAALVTDGRGAFPSARIFNHSTVGGNMGSRLDIPVTDEQQAAVKFAADAAGQSISEYVRRKVTVGAEPPPYRFSAGTVRDPSLIRDMAATAGWSTGENVEIDEAFDRLRKFSQWSEDNPIYFAPQTTATASQVISPGFRNAIAITLTADRPLVSATDQLPISAATPFTVPRWTSGGTVDSTRAEAAQPAEVDTVFGTATVTPKGLAGMLNLTRELVDGASPGGDIIALQVMRENWYAQAEALTYAELNGANGAGGTITAGFVPSGAQAVNDAAPTTGLLITLKKQLLQYANVRRRKARNVIAGGPALTNLGGLFGAEANTGDDTCLANIFGARLNAAVNTFGVAAGDSRILILGSGDVCTFESPLADFRFDEQAGPALVRCAVYGYFGVVVARPVGVSGIRF